jgi:hypothetical protein
MSGPLGRVVRLREREHRCMSRVFSKACPTAQLLAVFPLDHRFSKISLEASYAEGQSAFGLPRAFAAMNDVN